MSPTLYRIYRSYTAIKRRIRRKMSSTGRIMASFAALTILFGFNTRLTMIYQLAALVSSLLLVSLPLSWVFPTQLRLRRLLPQTCTAGERLTYLLQVENPGKRIEHGVFFTEIPEAGLPAFEEFDEEQEEGERDRNLVDRKLGYYRWLWLLKRKTGVEAASVELPGLLPGGKAEVAVSLLPIRRGFVRIRGFSLHRLDPLGMFKKEIVFGDAHQLLVLPRTYPVSWLELAGSRKYHRGGLAAATGCGESGEFVSLREYRAGDPVKHIDWKATARIGKTIVRQYQDEYFPRNGLLLDTFTERENAVFEDAVSVAASIVGGADIVNRNVDSLFVCDRCLSSVSTGNLQSAREYLLEVLACVRKCRNGGFADLTEVVMGYADILSGLILVLLEMDEQRKRLLDRLTVQRIPHKAILVTADSKGSLQLLRDYGLQDVALFDIADKMKVVDLR